jgi:hypothetical protein
VVAKIGNRTREEWDRFAETYYGYVLPTAQLKELISEAFDSRGLRDGLERAAKIADEKAAKAVSVLEALGVKRVGSPIAVERVTALDLARMFRAEASKLDGEPGLGHEFVSDQWVGCGFKLQNQTGIGPAYRRCALSYEMHAPEPPAEERKLSLGHAFDPEGPEDKCWASVPTPGTPLMQGCGQPRSAHEPRG